MLEPTHEEAIEEFTTVLQELGEDLSRYAFQIKDNCIRIGHTVDNDVQWSMRYFTPQEFKRMAKRRRLNLKSGDPRKG